MPGDVIVRQLEPGDAPFVIESGEVAVETVGAHGRLRLATLGPGEFFGGIGLITGAARTADVVALAPTTLLRLDRETYVRHLAEHSQVERHIAHAAAARAAERLRPGD